MSLAYKDLWSKVTVNDLRTNVFILEKSMEASSSRCEKDEEIGSSRKIQGKKGKAPMDDLDGQAAQSLGIIRESLGIRPIDMTRNLINGSDSEYDSETNFRHEGRKRHGTITPTNIAMGRGYDFVYDIESCSTKPANLDEVILFCLFSPISFYKRRHLDCLVFPPSLFFRLVSSNWYRRLHLLLMRIF